MMGEGGRLRGRLPALSGASRPGNGPPLACSIAVTLSSIASTMICARVRCAVQYTAFRRRSTSGTGSETVTRCLEGVGSDRADDGISWVLAPLM